MTLHFSDQLIFNCNNFKKSGSPIGRLFPNTGGNSRVKVTHLYE